MSVGPIWGGWFIFCVIKCKSVMFSLPYTCTNCVSNDERCCSDVFGNVTGKIKYLDTNYPSPHYRYSSESFPAGTYKSQQLTGPGPDACFCSSHLLYAVIKMRTCLERMCVLSALTVHASSLNQTLTLNTQYIQMHEAVSNWPPVKLRDENQAEQQSQHHHLRQKVLP